MTIYTCSCGYTFDNKDGQTSVGVGSPTCCCIDCRAAGAIQDFLRPLYTHLHAAHCQAAKIKAATSKEAIDKFVEDAKAPQTAKKINAVVEMVKERTEDKTCTCGYVHAHKTIGFAPPKDGKCQCVSCTGNWPGPYDEAFQPHAHFCHQKKVKEAAMKDTRLVELEAKVKELQGQLLGTQMDRTEDCWRDAYDTAVKECMGTIEEKEARIKELQKEKDDLDKEQKHWRERAGELLHAGQTATKQIDALLANVKDREETIAAYLSGEIALKAMVNELGTRMESMKEAQSKHYEAWRDECEAAKSRIEELEKENNRLHNKKKQLKDDIEELEEAIDDRDRDIDNLERKAKYRKERLHEINKAYNELKNKFTFNVVPDPPKPFGSLNVQRESGTMKVEFPTIFTYEPIGIPLKVKTSRFYLNMPDSLPSAISSTATSADKIIVKFSRPTTSVQLDFAAGEDEELAKTKALLDIANTEIKALQKQVYELEEKLADANIDLEGTTLFAKADRTCFDDLISAKQAEVDQLRAEAEGCENLNQRQKAKIGRLQSKLAEANKAAEAYMEKAADVMKERDHLLETRENQKRLCSEHLRERAVALDERDIYRNKQLLFQRYRRWVKHNTARRIIETINKNHHADKSDILPYLGVFPELRRSVLKEAHTACELQCISNDSYTITHQHHFIRMSGVIKELLDDSSTSGSTA